MDHPIQRNNGQSTNPTEGNSQNTSPTEDFARYGSLYLAARKDDWKTVKKFIDEHTDARTAETDEFGVTTLHLVVRNDYNSFPVLPMDPIQGNNTQSTIPMEGNTQISDPMEGNTESSDPTEGNTQISNPMEVNTEITNPTEDLIEQPEENNRGNDFTQYDPLYRAAQKGDWKTVKKLIVEDPDTMTAQINEDGATVLHLAVCKDETMLLVEYILNSIHERSLLENVDNTDNTALENADSTGNTAPENADNAVNTALEKADNTGNTALSYAAIVGNINAASKLVEKNERLLLQKDMDGYTPLHHAARVGHKEIVEFLLSKTKDKATLLSDESGATLLGFLRTSKLYGIALHILKQYMELFFENRDDESRVLKEVFKDVFKDVLRTLAQMPQEFASGNHLTFFPRFIYQWIPVTEENDHSLFFISIEGSTKNSANSTSGFFQRISNGFGKVNNSFWNIMKRTVPWINDIHDKKLRQMQALELVKLICKEVINSTRQEALLKNQGFQQDANSVFKEPLFLATRFGIAEFVNEIIEAYPDSAALCNEEDQNIYQFAVLYRQEHVFKFIYKLGIWTHLLACNIDKSGNNILHLAGKLKPSSQISGAALQMQRELQWFKAIENFVIDVRPSLLEDRNLKKLTPREVFTEKHKGLVKEGQEWMKNAAQSYTVVAALIITVTFAAAFTVPGGNKTEGVPIYLHNPAFITFVVSDAMGLISSCISVLMCLGILTSRYSEEDFLVSLPTKLILGIFTLYISLGCMMVAFSVALGIVLTRTKTNVSLPIVIVVISILFGFSQFRLLFKIIRSTYGPSFLQPNKLIRRFPANVRK